MISSSLTLETQRHWQPTCLPTTTCSTWWSCWQACCSWCCRCAKLLPYPHCAWMSTWVNRHAQRHSHKCSPMQPVSFRGSSVSDTSAGPCHFGAAGSCYGRVRAMHETPLVRLPHLHTPQEDHGEGNRSKCVLSGRLSNHGDILFCVVLLYREIRFRNFGLLLWILANTWKGSHAVCIPHVKV